MYIYVSNSVFVMYSQLADMVRHSMMTELQVFQRSLQVGSELSVILAISKPLNFLKHVVLDRLRLPESSPQTVMVMCTEM